MTLLDKIINRAKQVVGRGETPDPKAELARKKTKAQMNLSRFVKEEDVLKAQVTHYRTKAKSALLEGNTREYDVLKSQFSRVSGQLKIASASVDAARNIIGVMDSQENMGAIVEMGKNLAAMQTELGIDPAEMENAATNIRESMANADAVSQSLSSISDLVSCADGIEIGDPLKAELMAEIQAESEVNNFGEQIAAEMKELEE